jgi:tRNA threonylcarbamoyladenosine biosynthesis protein TsaE
LRIPKPPDGPGATLAPMPRMELVSESAAETERVAASLARSLERGDVVLVSGDLGTGKTTFVRGACRALGVETRVTSPSFTIGQRYSGRLPVSHVDLFRLDSLEHEDPALLGDYLEPDAVAFVEWPDAALPELEPERVALRVSMEHLGGDRRRLRLEAGEAMLDGLASA